MAIKEGGLLPMAIGQPPSTKRPPGASILVLARKRFGEIRTKVQFVWKWRLTPLNQANNLETTVKYFGYYLDINGYSSFFCLRRHKQRLLQLGSPGALKRLLENGKIG